MKRLYGEAPHNVAVIHGGPGIPGYMAPVARKLGESMGVVEPLQSKDSLEGQIDELKEELGTGQFTIIGSSYGAVLSCLLASRFPELVSKLILVGSAVFSKEHNDSTFNNRLERLSSMSRERFETLHSLLQDSDLPEAQSSTYFKEMGDIILLEADSYDPISTDLEIIDYQYSILTSVWADVEAMRDDGTLLKACSKIECPVLAIHGDYDPHPVEGVFPPLENAIRDFHSILLKQCGHMPWNEKNAYEEFFNILENEIVTP